MTDARIPKRSFADALLQARAHAFDDRGVKPDPCHEEEITARARRLNRRAPDIDATRKPARDHFDRLVYADGKLKLARQDVSRAARPDTNPHVRSDQALKRFIDRPVAARNDHFAHAARGCASCQQRCLAGAARVQDLHFETALSQQLAEARDLTRALTASASRVRIRDQDGCALGHKSPADERQTVCLSVESLLLNL